MTKKVNVFAVSLIALMTATAARADIASKAYVDQQIQPVESALSTHTSNADIHVTASDKTAWNAKEATANKSTTTTYVADLADSAKKDVMFPTLAATKGMIDTEVTAINTGLDTKQNMLQSSGPGTNVVAGTNTGHVVTGITANNGTVTVNKAAGAITDADINANAAIVKSKLASGVQDSLDLADTAVQPGDIGTAAEKDFTTSVSENGTGLPTAGAVYSAIAAAQTAATYDDSALDARVTANEGAITTLNGNASTSGSVANSIANALEDYTLKSVTASSGDGVVTSVSQSGSAVVSTKQKITSSHIASDAGILSSQLASGVQTTLTNAAADHTTISGYGDIVTHNASEFATNQFVGTIPSGSQATTVTGYVAEVAGTAGSALQSVTANNNAGVVTNIAKDGTAVTMTKAKVTGADIADNANIAATQLASGVQTSLGYADAYHTASATYGDIITHNAAEFASAAADGAVMTVTTDDSTGNVVTAVSANNNGTVTVTKGITAIPKPSGNCTDCVLHYAGASGEFSWEEVGR